MNYGRKNISKQHRAIHSRTTRKRKKIAVRAFKITLLSLALFCLVGVLVGGLLFKKIIDNTPKITPNDVKPSKYTTTAYANDGTTILDTFIDAGSNRVYASLQEIPDYLENAFIAIEDSRFREHNGIDIWGIARAFVTGLAQGQLTQGASTITQQLIKNSIFPNFVQESWFQRIERKIQEQYLAIELEKQMDKDQILENYLNTINLGQNTLGVESAAKRYFGKSVSELTLSESVTIAAITQNPTRYNPITNPEKNQERRKKVLDDMMEQGMIDQSEHDEALADNVYTRIQTANSEYTENISVSSYFIDAVAKQVMQDLIDELGYSETLAYNAVYSGGLKIVTTQDIKMQQICEKELNNEKNYPTRVDWGVSCAISILHADGTQNHYDQNGLNAYVKKKYGETYGTTFSSKDEANAMVNEYINSLMTQTGDTVQKRVTLSPQPQASIVIMDQYTGEVKALVGGRGEKTESRSLNRATQSMRQPGSCFKVLSTYVPALDTNGDSLATMINDSPYKYKTGESVDNWWSGYRGNMTIRECIKTSANVCTVKKFTEITPTLGFNYLTENFGFTTLDSQKDIVQAASLGGITHGVYNIEMSAAYASIANNGVYTEPILYTKIYDHNGNLVFEKTPNTHVAMKASTAALITDAMIDVVSASGGTGSLTKLSNMPSAGKTGTTTKNKDVWFCGYTPYLTCSIWSGYDDSQPMEGDGQNTSYHKKIWRQVMQQVHEGYERKNFTMPKEGIVKKTICASTGKLASSDLCQKYTEYFAEGTIPKQSCPGHADAPVAPTPNTDTSAPNT